jgi:phosphoglycerate dehydrogenase-like enzyme
MKSPLNVVVCAPIMGSDLDPVRAVDAYVNVIDGNAVFDAFNRARQAKDAAAIEATEKQMRSLLAQADVLCMMHPMLKTAHDLAPNMQWLHHTQAGVSNLWSSDVWEAEQVLLTSGRGHVRPTAMAEYCVAAALAFARSLHDGYLDKAGGKLDRSHYQPLRVEGATMGVIGMGGIGGEVARLSKALGMRVVATRRSVTTPQENAEGADLLLPASQLKRLAAESDFIAVCTQLTRDTLRLLDTAFFDATEKRPVLANVSRGEVIDEDALLAALDAGKLRGAVLDVFDGEMDGKAPRQEFFAHPNVILTPHVSAGGATSDTAIMDLFCENLRRFIKGEEMLNLVDRARGY